MQNYGPPSQGYQRPGSIANSGGPPPPAPYGVPTDCQNAFSSASPQWAPHQQTGSQWTQPEHGGWGHGPHPQQQQLAGAYNPGIYGAMPGAYGHAQLQDQPPPPPPKHDDYPQSMLGRAHQAQGWAQAEAYGVHQTHQKNGQPGNYAQQPYNASAPPPLPPRPAVSQFPTIQAQPASAYGLDQPVSYSTSSSVAQQPDSPVPNSSGQQPAYIPPSQPGQSLQSYMPVNTSPNPGVHTQPPTNAPAWQHAGHMSFQGPTKDFVYSEPSSDSGIQSQGYQSLPQSRYSQLPPLPHRYAQEAQKQFQSHERQYSASTQPDHFAKTSGTAHHQACQSGQQESYQQQPTQQWPQQQPGYQYALAGDQRYSTPHAEPSNAQVSASSRSNTPGHPFAHDIYGSSYASKTSQPYPSASHQQSQASKPFERQTNHQSPGSHPVSPILQNRQSVSSLPPQRTSRTASVSSIALDAIRNQHTQKFAKTSSPVPTTREDFTPPALGRTTTFSALGSGGPSDWEHLGRADDEIDDEELFGTKKEQSSGPTASFGAELPGSQPSQVTQTTDWPSPEQEIARPHAWQHHMQAHQDSAQISPPVTNTSFVTGHAAAAAAQSVPCHHDHKTEIRALSSSHTAELRAKDIVIEHLKAQAERERANIEEQKREIEKAKLLAEQQQTKLTQKNVDLVAEAENLKQEIENAKSHAVNEQVVLNAQVEELKKIADQASSNAEALANENSLTIERLKEDAEGQQVEIKAKNATIQDLKQQLEAEKLRKLPQAVPADLVHDLDPWYAGSLERFIAMLRNEAGEARVEAKIQVFTSFLRDESRVRGLEYYTTPVAPLAPPRKGAETPGDGPANVSRRASDASSRNGGVNIDMPRAASAHDDTAQYSPGGRPILQSRPPLSSSNSLPTFHSSIAAPSADFPSDSASQSIIYTPPSSTDDDGIRTPVQSAPQDGPDQQQQYKAYVPAAVSIASIHGLPHRQSISTAAPTNARSTQDDIFFRGTSSTSPDPSQQRITSSHGSPVVPIPAPLAVISSRDNMTDVRLGISSASLLDFLPQNISTSRSHPRMQAIKKELETVPSDLSSISTLTADWERTAISTRKKNDAARQKRQEDSDAHTDELFNNDEISYADIGDIDDEFKEEERKRKAQEDRDEYQSYVVQVFDKAYSDIQSRIKALTNMYISVESQLHSSVSGLPALTDIDSPTTKEVLGLLLSIHRQIETCNERIVLLVADRDKRYKKTEVQPLYAAGNVKTMKAVETHFETAGKQASVRAKSDKAARVGEIVRNVEDVVVGAVGKEQEAIEKILDGVRALSDDAIEYRNDVLALAKEAFMCLRQSSEDLLCDFNDLELELNASVLRAEIAQATADNAEAAKIQGLEEELSRCETKTKEELDRRIRVMDQDTKDLEQLLKLKGLPEGYVRKALPPRQALGQVKENTETISRSRAQTDTQTRSRAQTESRPTPVLSEEEEKKRRLAAALEAAKRRNGAL